MYAYYTYVLLLHTADSGWRRRNLVQKRECACGQCLFIIRPSADRQQEVALPRLYVHVPPARGESCVGSELGSTQVVLLSFDLTKCGVSGESRVGIRSACSWARQETMWA